MRPKEKGYYRVVSAGQLSFESRPYCRLSRRMQGWELKKKVDSFDAERWHVQSKGSVVETLRERNEASLGIYIFMTEKYQTTKFPKFCFDFFFGHKICKFPKLPHSFLSTFQLRTLCFAHTTDKRCHFVPWKPKKEKSRGFFFLGFKEQNDIFYL